MKKIVKLAKAGLFLGTALMGISQAGIVTQAYSETDIETLENIRAYRDYLDSILEAAGYDDDTDFWYEDEWEDWTEDEGAWYRISSTYKPGIAIRQQPTKDSTLLCRIPYGTEFYVEYFCDGWGYTTVNGYSGWTDLDYSTEILYDDYAWDCWEDVYDTEEDGIYGFYKDGSVVYEFEYILPESEYRYLTEADVEHLTWKGLCYAKNELYARHGRTFAAEELQEFFDGQTWYCGIYEPRTYDSQIVSLMNKYEKYNIDVLRKAEEKIGEYPVK